MNQCCIILFSLIFAVGCNALDPDVGPLLGGICINDDSDPDTSVSFSKDIVPQILAPANVGCLNCHSPTAPTPFGFEVSGLDVSSYGTLRSGGSNSGTDIIIPGSPCDSILLQKTQPGPPFGGRMPLSGGPFLSAQVGQLLHDWIAEGARNN